MRRRPLRLSVLCLLAPALVAAKPAEKPEDASPPAPSSVALQGLNKVTGHISKLEGPLGGVLSFDKLEIVAHRCWKAPPEERPENAALLDIAEIKTGAPPERIFLGWMFSSSPGLSGLEHPVYDITVLSCDTRGQPEETGEKKDEKKS